MGIRNEARASKKKKMKVKKANGGREKKGFKN